MGKKKEGPKRIGTTKPPKRPSHKTAPPALPKSRVVGKKKSREAATAAAWALIGEEKKGKTIKKSNFAY
jgi:hypothetical protein|eukprot:CAMPEP_0181209942 /NCGR_PEP_ID=MMETSP1096-20121128/22958_1 /TAXON_ID=156174 ORGANISM="Chrysochromulina ericina, Strain CCMP281" /NCGR_SAMPLE_ID=MMETSP1096 /ASSEMBLY_ACC=CAM_ASM_000453 /LENGTH=68 /DNA_ID=CAMNT_0023301183 /DNA_START=26 /DNA_END=232 /DNA_ORIENTATION=+